MTSCPQTHGINGVTDENCPYCKAARRSAADKELRGGLAGLGRSVLGSWEKKDAEIKALNDRIAALEAALDWALPAVFEHYESGEAPKTPGAYDEIEKGRKRILAELERLQSLQTGDTTSDRRNRHRGLYGFLMAPLFLVARFTGFLVGFFGGGKR